MICLKMAYRGRNMQQEHRKITEWLFMVICAGGLVKYCTASPVRGVYLELNIGTVSWQINTITTF